VSDEQLPGATEVPVTSTRDQKDLRRRIEAWMATRLPAGAEPSVPPLDSPAANGWSSETLLFDATWTDGGATTTERLVARVAPDLAAMPVFPHYDMPAQARVMQAAADLTGIPVPAVRWVEPDASVLGEPFFVMARVDGDVPPDIPPYDMGGWVLDATPEQRARLEAGTVDVLAALFSTRDRLGELDFLQFGWPGESALQRHFANERHYWSWIADGRASATVERVEEWLISHWPSLEGPPLLSWGDSRYGNVMYRDFTPVAVLDWEMAAIAPPELDLAYLAYMHAYFESIAHRYGLPGLADLGRLDQLATSYEASTGYAPRDLGFYTVYNAYRHLLITLRIALRRMRFGELVRTEHLDDAVDPSHLQLLDELMAGAVDA
jgi:aminoglycoside phosphotransferase (APT) family kinase protein